MVTVEVQNLTVRHPVSLVTHDGEYSLIVHPLDVGPLSLNNHSFIVEEKSNDASNGVPYAVVDNNALKFKYAVKANPAISQVYLTLYGSSVQNVMQNDSMVCFSLQCKSLSVRYGKDEPINLYVKADKFFSAGVPPEYFILSEEQQPIFPSAFAKQKEEY